MDVKILITGAGGFLGRNLSAELQNLRGWTGMDGEKSGRLELLLCHRNTDLRDLSAWCKTADFVFHLAGVNRAGSPEDFWAGNLEFTQTLLARLRRAGNPSPIVFASSIQAGRASPYGKSKLAAEEALFRHREQTGAEVWIYRLPHIFGKWSRPEYNSVVATFCHRIARGLPAVIQDPDLRLELAYIDDVVKELLNALAGSPHRSGTFCRIPTVYSATLQELADLLWGFAESRASGGLPAVGTPFAKKLYATYVSFLPREALLQERMPHRDHRGSFTELFRTPECGQFSVSITKPGVTRGLHWHHTKVEKFIVLQGEGELRFRSPEGEVRSFQVSGNRPAVVDIPPGDLHSIKNQGQDDLVTLIWASECFDPDRPDTYGREV